MEQNTPQAEPPTLKDIKSIAADLGFVAERGYTNKALSLTETQRQTFRKVARLAKEISESIFPLPDNCSEPFKGLQDIATILPRTLTKDQHKNNDVLVIVNSTCNYIDLVYRTACVVQDWLDRSARTAIHAPRTLVSPHLV